MPWSNFHRLLGVALALLVPLLGVLFILWVFNYGDTIGQAKVQARWDQHAKLQAQAVAQLQAELRNQEAQHRVASQRISDELVQAQSDYQAALVRHRAEFAQRLQHSESRARHYQRQARGDTAEQLALAEHAARLDRTLEEGRSLVRELREVVGQRERTIRTLSQQIHADRRLLTN